MNSHESSETISSNNAKAKETQKLNMKLMNLSKNLETEKEQLIDQNHALQEKIKEQKQELVKVNIEKAATKSKVLHMNDLKNENKSLIEKLSMKQKQVVSMKKENFVKRCNRKLRQLNNKCLTREKKVNKVKQKLKTSKLIKENMKKQPKSVTTELQNMKFIHKATLNKQYSKLNYWKTNAVNRNLKLHKLMVENENLKQNSLNRSKELIMQVNENEQPLVTKENNKYTDDMRTCVMDLQSIDIPINKISNVMKSVGQHLFHECIETPSKTTIQNIADEALFISKHHVAEKIKNAENFGFFF
ncbi:hypothetical protein SNE40_020713 [Patella caerulea]|uniref:Uncharacterized protein n=1 Tax=Patella caerulea TaxID=87958 RepID=A0AAN8J5J7_PATCE